MADPAHPVSTAATSISFGFLSSEYVRRISVKQITNPQLFDNLNNPNLGGLYDPALGPIKRGDMCVINKSFEIGGVDRRFPSLRQMLDMQTFFV